MPQREHDLTALLGSRICHDLISPLGAIGNGLELLSMSGTASAEITLISESVANANARVRFYRVAYGAASVGQVMGRGEIVGILDDLTCGSRLRVVWTPPGEVTRRDAKLAFLILQCFETAMPYGGEVVVTAKTDGWRFHGMATKFKIQPELWDLLGGGDSDVDLSPAQVQFALVAEMLMLNGREATLTLGEQDVVLCC